MLRFLGIILAGMLALTSPAKADLTDIDQDALDTLFKAYIEANPEVLRNALMGLAKREAEAAQNAAFSMLYMDDGDPVLGNPDGDIVVYEFTDYNCGYCKRVYEPIQQVLAEDGNIRFVVKEFPILSQSSLLAAQAGVAAAAQDVFEAYHRNMMTSVVGVSMDSILAAAEDAGADMERLQLDMNSDAVNAIIARTRQAASRLEINGTPGLVIGKTVVPGAISAEELKSIIASERAERG